MDGELSDNQAYLVKVAQMRMPFGKYKGLLLVELPEEYVIWFEKKGYPKGELGRMLELVREIKLNGLEYLLRPLKGFRIRNSD